MNHLRETPMLSQVNGRGVFLLKQGANIDDPQRVRKTKKRKIDYTHLQQYDAKVEPRIDQSNMNQFMQQDF
jgi:hypothetical protein